MSRESAVKCVRSLTEILGGSWAERQLLPKIIIFQTNPNYLHRMTPLFCILVLDLF